MHILVVGNYPPRKCGIATFTENLVKSLLYATKSMDISTIIEVAAMNDNEKGYNYPEIVKHTLRQNVLSDYTELASYINQSTVDHVIVQHEFGIYGGSSGAMLLAFMNEIEKPIATTLHTILKDPNFFELNILKRIVQKSSKIIVMSKFAVGILKEVYMAPREKISVIHHGVPDFGENFVEKYSENGKRRLMTFGLIGRSKGIETVIKSLPEIVSKYPDLEYVILGKTHPHVLANSGEEYRDFLKELTKKFHLENNVTFVDKFTTEDELKEYLVSTDIYVTPYLNKAQITSGALAYAIGAGAAVVSTPYWHAEEFLSDGSGRLFDFGDSEELSSVILDLLEHPNDIADLRRASFAKGQELTWPKIGVKYLKELISINKDIPEDFSSVTIGETRYFGLPKLDFSHVQRLTDSTGMIQHGYYSAPNFATGYTLDDNSRALMLVCMAYQDSPKKKYIDLMNTYSAFLKFVQTENGNFRNLVSYQRTYLDDIGTDDSFGRTIWSLGYMVRYAPGDSLFRLSHELFEKAMPHFDKLKYARGIANSLLGMYHYSKRFTDQNEIKMMIRKMSDKLLIMFEKESRKDWFWFEENLTYDNALLPTSLMRAHEILGDNKYKEVAFKTLEFLESVTYRGSYFSFIGNYQWMQKGERKSLYGQQALDTMAMVLMYHDAFKLTNDNDYMAKMEVAFSWFMGNNDVFLPLYDCDTKGCNDGLEDFGVNRNQGAESTISFWISSLLMRRNFEFNTEDRY